MSCAKLADRSVRAAGTYHRRAGYFRSGGNQQPYLIGASRDTAHHHLTKLGHNTRLGTKDTSLCTGEWIVGLYIVRSEGGGEGLIAGK